MIIDEEIELPYFSGSGCIFVTNKTDAFLTNLLIFFLSSSGSMTPAFRRLASSTCTRRMNSMIKAQMIGGPPASRKGIS